MRGGCEGGGPGGQRHKQNIDPPACHVTCPLETVAVTQEKPRDHRVRTNSGYGDDYVHDVQTYIYNMQVV